MTEYNRAQLIRELSNVEIFQCGTCEGYFGQFFAQVNNDDEIWVQSCPVCLSDVDPIESVHTVVGTGIKGVNQS